MLINSSGCEASHKCVMVSKAGNLSHHPLPPHPTASLYLTPALYRIEKSCNFCGSAVPRVHKEKRVSNFYVSYQKSVWSVYSSVFTYNPYVLTRPYLHLSSAALIELHHITYISLDISILIVRFGDWAHTCRVDAPQKRTKVSRLFELSDNNQIMDYKCWYWKWYYLCKIELKDPMSLRIDILTQ